MLDMSASLSYLLCGSEKNTSIRNEKRSRHPYPGEIYPQTFRRVEMSSLHTAITYNLFGSRTRKREKSQNRRRLHSCLIFFPFFATRPAKDPSTSHVFSKLPSVLLCKHKRRRCNCDGKNSHHDFPDRTTISSNFSLYCFVNKRQNVSSQYLSSTAPDVAELSLEARLNCNTGCNVVVSWCWYGGTNGHDRRKAKRGHSWSYRKATS
mmetsp:Transcript_11505/g.12456  ORF Transcript_11505/g.12456 Transcript_11505/m.12456 type:complete len:207 (+) Transcript_11505:1634-2254(+)